MRKFIFGFLFVAFAMILSVGVPAQADGPVVQSSPQVTEATHHDKSKPLRKIRIRKHKSKRVVIPVKPIPRSYPNAGGKFHDPLARRSRANSTSAPTPGVS